MPGIDGAWELYFARSGALAEIEKRGFAYVSAVDLKKLAEWEPRLLAKQDTLEQRPGIFKTNNLAIFPVKNGRYIIFRDVEQKTYYQFSQAETEIESQSYVSNVRLSEYDAYPRSGISNEMQAIDFAYISSLLRTITQEDKLDLVLRGRTYSGQFDFVLPEVEHKVEVTSVQIEVDGGYESPGAIYLIEGKLGRHPNFHIRQLYYPYLEWSHRSQKRIVPIFLVYTNSRYYFYEFSFEEAFGAAKVVQQQCYVLDDAHPPRMSLGELLTEVAVEDEPPRLPFPQANDLDKVLDLIGLLASGGRTKNELAEVFDFDERQGDYYGNAARYLGLATKAGETFELTEVGRRVLAASTLGDKSIAVMQQLVKRPIFRRALQELAAASFDLGALTDNGIARIISEETGLTGTTPPRRASTVRAWLDWMKKNGQWV